ncbi:MAG: 7-carboxy-7-deazaguanine synthase QueE [Planctomycetota bacterium]|jgi:organic radical activating enzyme
MDSAHLFLDEVFLSLQGEGLEVGRPHLFLRLGGCPLRCTYCDTPRSWEPRQEYEIFLAQDAEIGTNPLNGADLDRLLGEVLTSYGLQAKEVMLAVTGGEPLQQADFLESWLPSWEGPVLLETAGILADELKRILPMVDLLSLDWKLPNTLRVGEELLESRACLEAASTFDGRCQVKLVLTEQHTEEEVGAALDVIAEMLTGVVVFLQPVTPFGKGPEAPAAGRLLHWSLAYRELPLELRVLPQVHPLLGVR